MSILTQFSDITTQKIASVFLFLESSGIFLQMGFLIIFTLVLQLIFKKSTSVIGRFISKSKNEYDNLFWNKTIQKWLPRLGTIVIVYSCFYRLKSGLTTHSNQFFYSSLSTLLFSLLLITLLMNINGLLDGILESLKKIDLPDNVNFKGIIQLIKILFYLVTAIFIISAIIGDSPWKLLSGLGAVTAILLLIFREPILGLVSGIQLFANNMVKVGDWIEINSHQVNGNIVDISLTTVRVQNWDMTIVSIPNHALVTGAFKNWRGMTEKGGRRIKRSFFINLNSIHFLTQTECTKLKKHPLIKKHLQQTTLDETPNQFSPDTNLKVFREYLYYYLRHHPEIHQSLTLLVHQLNPSEQGLPLQIYAFSKNTDWEFYENLQSEIVEHIIAIAPQFSLSIHQSPTSDDFKKLAT